MLQTSHRSSLLFHDALPLHCIGPESCLSALLAARVTYHGSGNTMQATAGRHHFARAQRQKELVRVFYVEVAALEDVLEEAVYALGTDARTILVQIRKCARWSTPFDISIAAQQTPGG
jgi:ribosomal protein S9